MIYLSGVKVPGRPLMLAPSHHQRGATYGLDDVPLWALDNGAFTGRYPGDERFEQLMRRRRAHADRCLFVVAPDVVANRPQTLELWGVWSDRIRQLGYRAALALQDGMTGADVAAADPDWLFVGGSTGYKLSATVRGIVADAGIPSHLARVNSRRRLAYASLIGCTSADGTLLAFDPHRPIYRWADHLAAQTMI